MVDRVERWIENGTYVDDHERGSGRGFFARLVSRIIEHDGRETSLLLSLSIVCFALALMISEQITIDSKFFVSPACALLMLVVLQIICIVFMCYAIRMKTIDSTFVTFNNQYGSETKLTKIKSFGGLWVFGAGGIILDMLSFTNAVASYGDKDDWGACRVHLISQMLFHIVKLAFFAVQIHFLQLFYHATFTNLRSTRYMVYIIMSVNALVWMSCFQQQVQQIKSHYPSSLDFVENDHHQDDSQVYNCSLADSNWTQIIGSPGIYLYPFTMEYSFIAIGLLFHILENLMGIDKKREQEDLECTRELASIPPPLYDSVKSVVSETSNADNSDERTPLLRADNMNESATQTSSHAGDHLSSLERSVSHASVQTKYYIPPNDPNESNKFTWWFIGLTVLLIVHATLEILAVVRSNDDPKTVTTSDDWILYLNYSFQLLFFVVTSVLGYFGITFCEKNPKGFSGEDFSLSISGAGAWLVHIFGIIPAVTLLANERKLDQDKFQHPTSLSVVLIVMYLFNMLQVFYQNWFAMKASGRNFRKNLNETQKRKLYNCVAFLSVFNFVKWALDSFCEFESAALFPIQLTVFGINWIHINLVVYPMAIFYRFYIATLYFKLIC